jgi:signal transduction histidine kinase
VQPTDQAHPVSEAALRLAFHVAAVLEGDADGLAQRWQARAEAVTPTAPTTEEQELSGLGPPRSKEAVRAIVSAIINAPSWRASVARWGWSFGASSHAAGHSLHVASRHAALLGELLLHAAEVASMEGDRSSLEPAGADAGIAVARRLHRAIALLASSAAQGFTHAHLERLQERYRLARHDLRNPLSTIKNAIALMEDESVPVEVRANPRYRGIINRSVTAIDTLIGERLDEASALSAALDWHDVSLYAIAVAVRRELREEMIRAGCQIEIDPALPTVHTDPAVFELSVASTLSVFLRAVETGAVIRVSSDHSSELSVVVSFSVTPPSAMKGPLPPDALDFPRQLLSRIGGRVTGGEKICIEMPIANDDKK